MKLILARVLLNIAPQTSFSLVSSDWYVYKHLRRSYFMNNEWTIKLYATIFSKQVFSGRGWEHNILNLARQMAVYNDFFNKEFLSIMGTNEGFRKGYKRLITRDYNSHFNLMVNVTNQDDYATFNYDYKKSILRNHKYVFIEYYLFLNKGTLKKLPAELFRILFDFLNYRTQLSTSFFPH